MKKLLYFFLLIVACVACKDDDDDQKMASIIGKWQGDRSEVKVLFGGIQLDKQTNEDYNDIVEFKEDGTVTYTNNGNATTGTYEVSGNTLTTTVDIEIGGVDITDLSFTISKLEETELELNLNREQEVEHPDYGMVTVDIIGEFKFNRL